MASVRVYRKLCRKPKNFLNFSNCCRRRTTKKKLKYRGCSSTHGAFSSTHSLWSAEWLVWWTENRKIFYIFPIIVVTKRPNFCKILRWFFERRCTLQHTFTMSEVLSGKCDAQKTERFLKFFQLLLSQNDQNFLRNSLSDGALSNTHSLWAKC